MSCLCSKGVADRLDRLDRLKVMKGLLIVGFLLIPMIPLVMCSSFLKHPVTESTNRSRLFRCSIVNLSISLLDILASFH